MKKGLTVFLASCAMTGLLIALSGCSGDETRTITGHSTDTTYQGSLTATGKYSGSITGRVFSAANGNVLTGVTVAVTGDQEGNTGASRTVVTDANGYYQFTNLALGDYLLTIQPMTGYSGKRAQVQVVVPAGHPAIGTDVNLLANVQKDFDLLPLKATTSGFIYVEKEKVLAKTAGNRFTASGAVVQVYIPNEIPDRYSDTTDATGAFSLANLPATALRSINAEVLYLSFTDNDGTRFASKIDTVQLQEGGNVLNVAYLAKYQEPLVLLKSNVKSVGDNSVVLNSDILLIMSSDIDATRLTNIMLKDGSGQGVPVSVSASNDSVTINPSMLLSAGSDYSLIYQLFSTDGRISVVDTLSFSTVKGIAIQSVSYYATDMSRIRLGVSSNIVINWTLAPVIDPVQTQIQLTDAVGLIQTRVTISGSTLTISPAYNLLTNTKYTLAIVNLKSAITGDNFNWTDSVYTELTNAPVSAVTGVTLQDVAFKANYNTLGIPIKWNRSTDAASYSIYIKNTVHPAWLLLAANTDIGDNFSSVQRHTVSLNSPGLDPIVNGATIEPFGLGAVCSLKVVPVNIDGIEGAAATQALFGIRDQTQPQIYNNALFTAKSDVNMNNVSGATVTINFTVEFTEYMNTSGTPTLQFESGTITGATLSNWSWEATEGALGKNVATFQVGIQNNTNLNGEEIEISNIQDQSGNSISTGVTITLTDL
ncbi:MAG: carboxypeptidase regulatory-like domain-containing protein [Fibrobacterota bacterium]